ncbi:MAG: DUF429 domain-containing protein [Pseudomonadota bacterium]
MPATLPPSTWYANPAHWTKMAGTPHVLGLDGCPDGWVVALLSLPTKTSAKSATSPVGDTAPKNVTLGFMDHFEQVLAHRQAYARTLRGVVVDMPIGLLDWGRRPCEAMARKKLGPRSSSVFACPRRPMLAFDTYEEANRWGKSGGHDSGGGLSKQAWNLLPKIRQIDDLIAPADQAWLSEGHPEVTFTRLNDGPCTFSKKEADGQSERKDLLARAGLRQLDPLIDAVRSDRPFRHHADDLLDALAMAVTARGRLNGEAWCLGDDVPDARGLKMHIWA